MRFGTKPHKLARGDHADWPGHRRVVDARARAASTAPGVPTAKSLSAGGSRPALGRRLGRHRDQPTGHSPFLNLILTCVVPQMDTATA